MNRTKIEYLTHTWNPTHGCSHAGSPGCDHCWARVMSIRLAGMGVKGYSKDEPFKVVPNLEKLGEPMSLKKPSRIGVSFMGDLFHEDLKNEIISWVQTTMNFCPRHTFVILTKRPERMKRYFEDCPPHPNCWLGVSVENQRTADERIPVLLQIPATVHFVSVEPMLSEIDLGEFQPFRGNKYKKGSFDSVLGILSGNIRWVICGCESGQNRRECKEEWIVNLVDQCIETGTPFFLKQMEIYGKVVKMPELDGIVWDQYPEAK